MKLSFFRACAIAGPLLLITGCGGGDDGLPPAPGMTRIQLAVQDARDAFPSGVRAILAAVGLQSAGMVATASLECGEGTAREIHRPGADGMIEIPTPATGTSCELRLMGISEANETYLVDTGFDPLLMTAGHAFTVGRKYLVSVSSPLPPTLNPEVYNVSISVSPIQNSSVSLTGGFTITGIQVAIEDGVPVTPKVIPLDSLRNTQTGQFELTLGLLAGADASTTLVSMTDVTTGVAIRSLMVDECATLEDPARLVNGIVVLRKCFFSRPTIRAELGHTYELKLVENVTSTGVPITWATSQGSDATPPPSSPTETPAELSDLDMAYDAVTGLVTVVNRGAGSATWSATDVSFTPDLNPPLSFTGGSYPGTGGSCSEIQGLVVLGGGASCTIAVSNATTGTLFIAAEDFFGSYTVWHDFGSAPPGGDDVSYVFLSYDRNSGIVTASNVGGGAAWDLTASVEGDFELVGGSYPGAGGNCGARLEAGASCTLSVQSTGGSGAGTLTLDVADDFGGYPTSVNLSVP